MPSGTNFGWNEFTAPPGAGVKLRFPANAAVAGAIAMMVATPPISTDDKRPRGPIGPCLCDMSFSSPVALRKRRGAEANLCQPCEVCQFDLPLLQRGKTGVAACRTAAVRHASGKMVQGAQKMFRRRSR